MSDADEGGVPRRSRRSWDGRGRTGNANGVAHAGMVACGARGRHSRIRLARGALEKAWCQLVLDVVKEKCGSRTCKPNSVRGIAPAGRPFLWAAHRCGALATYPKVCRTGPAAAHAGGVGLPPF